MPDMVSDDTSGTSVSRRYYLGTAAAAITAGLAGCSGSSGNNNQSGNGSNNQNGGSNSGSGPMTVAGSGGAGNAISILVDNVPEQSNLNPWASTTNQAGSGLVKDLSRPLNQKTAEYINSGHTFKAPWIDGTNEISVAALVKDVKFNPPYDYTLTLDDRLTYWDGTTIDARALKLHDKLEYYVNGLKFDDTATFNHEVVDKTHYHSWRDKGKVKGQEKYPASKQIMQGDANPGIPFHPKWVKPYLDRLKDASSKKKVNKIVKEIQGDTVTFSDFADKNLGSGLYRVKSSDEISSQHMVAHLRKDHPNADHAGVKKLEVQFASSNRRNVLLNQGKVDIGGGVVAKSNGTLQRSALPDSVEQVDKWENSAGGNQILFNWNNKHLANLWVRRAIVAATDWKNLIANTWGLDTGNPTHDHVGLLDSMAEATFSKSFLKKMYTYPIKPNTELATKWMKKAGYTKNGGRWQSPDGAKISLDLKYQGSDYTAASQTFRGNMEDFGIKVNSTGLDDSAFTKAMKVPNMDFDIAMEWAGQASVWRNYWTQAYWWESGFLSGDPTANSPYFLKRSSTGEDALGRPLKLEIPKDVGSIEAPQKAGTHPNLQNGEQINLAKLVYQFHDPDITDRDWKQAAQKCARYYNYYLPSFFFRQALWGLWGNTEKFKFPPKGNPVNPYQNGVNSDYFSILAGVPQSKNGGQ